MKIKNKGILLSSGLLFFSLKLIAQCTVTITGPDTVCYGASIQLDAGPGFTSYAWPNGSLSQTMSAYLTHDSTFTCTVTNSLGDTCTDQHHITVRGLPLLSLTTVNPSCSVCYDGQLTVTITPYFPDYQILWNGGLDSSFTLSGVGAGDYTCIVLDNLCSGYFWTPWTTLLTGPLGTGPHLVEGNIFLDADSNGVKNGNESGLLYSKVKMMPDHLTAFADSNGNYAFLVDTGVHYIFAVTDSDLVVTSDSLSYTVNVTSGNYSGYDFGVNGTLNGDIYCFITGTMARCNSTDNVTVVPFVFAPQNQNGYAKIVFDSAFSLNTTIPPASYINGDTAIWNFNTPSAYISMFRTVSLSVPSLPGYVYTISSETALLDSNNNVVLSCSDDIHDTIRCSWDPNEKWVDPPGIGPQHYTYYDQNNTLKYLINFQNTGNDTAFTVFIKDTLDADLDISTFRVLNSSHPMTVTIQDHLVEFRFNNIMLADSGTNESASHGFVNYSVSPFYPSNGSFVVSNTANIYFDSNTPVRTNTTFNTIDLSTGIEEETSNTGSDYLVYPNPSGGNYSIRLKTKQIGIPTLELYSLQGNKIKAITATSISTSDNTMQFNTDGIANGIYLLKISVNNTERFIKLVKI